MTRLTDTQLVLLSTAAQRHDDDLLPLPQSLGDEGKARKAIVQLLNRGLLSEHDVDTAESTWRVEDDRRIGVVINDAGKAAIGVSPRTPIGDAPADAAIKALPCMTKKAEVIALLRQEGGTTLDAIIAATGWLPHTTRAALTGLRKSGMKVGREKVNGVTNYRIETA